MRRRLGALLRTLRRVAWSNRDLATLWLMLMAAQPLVPPGHILAEPDLVLWTALTLGMATFLRGRALGAGPHPMLVPRDTGMGRFLRAMAGALAPLALALLYLMARQPDGASAGRAATALTLVGVLRFLSREQGRTAWDPRTGARWLPPLAVVVVVGSAVVSLGRMDADAGEGPVAWATRSALLGLSCAVVGLLHGDGRDLAQRLTAGRSDGKGVAIEFFRPALALLGPSLGLLLLRALAHVQLGPVGYAQGFVVSLFVLAWVAVLWPRPTPLLVPCLLHEIVPSGGRDLPAEDAARGFERAPEGALRLNPLDIQRTRAVHPWLVPVRGARIQELDDPVRPLWPRRTAPSPAHVLGEASFEPDPLTGAPQTDVLTLRLARRSDTSTLRAGSEQSRSIVVLRAWPDLAAASVDQPTYAWDEQLPPGARQVMDAATDRLELTDGAVLVLSSEGVARAYELEIGEPLSERRALEHLRPPQLEDYVEVGG